MLSNNNVTLKAERTVILHFINAIIIIIANAIPLNGLKYAERNYVIAFHKPL